MTILEKEKQNGKIRKIKINREKCIGARSCAFLAPGVFQLDEENLAYIVDPDSTEDDQILLAAKSCPVLAIEIFDEDGNKLV
jgi:ferredoxin